MAGLISTVGAVPVALCLIGVAVLLAGEKTGRRVLQVPAKLVASSCFVWLAIVVGALDSDYGRLVLLALCLCWLGDVLLLATGQSRRFLAGIGAFLAGHVAYSIAFARLPLDAVWIAAAVVGMGLFGVAVLRWLMPGLSPRFRRPVVVYVIAIGIMVVLAAGATGGGAPVLIVVAAVVFALSDVTVARDRFVAHAFANRVLGLPAYYLAQLGLAVSAGLLSAAP